MLRTPILCGLAFGAICGLGAAVGHGLIHHSPTLSTVLLWVLTPSVYAEQACKWMTNAQLEGYAEILLIVLVQATLGTLVCLLISRIIGRRKN